MQNNVIVVRAWPLDAEKATAASLETASLFSLLGLVVSIAVLLTSSPTTVAAITAALS